MNSPIVRLIKDTSDGPKVSSSAGGILLKSVSFAVHIAKTNLHYARNSATCAIKTVICRSNMVLSQEKAC